MTDVGSLLDAELAVIGRPEWHHFVAKKETREEAEGAVRHRLDDREHKGECALYMQRGSYPCPACAESTALPAGTVSDYQRSIEALKQRPMTLHGDLDPFDHALRLTAEAEKRLEAQEQRMAAKRKEAEIKAAIRTTLATLEKEKQDLTALAKEAFCLNPWYRPAHPMVNPLYRPIPTMGNITQYLLDIPGVAKIEIDRDIVANQMIVTWTPSPKVVSPGVVHNNIVTKLGEVVPCGAVIRVERQKTDADLFAGYLP